MVGGGFENSMKNVAILILLLTAISLLRLYVRIARRRRMTVTRSRFEMTVDDVFPLKEMGCTVVVGTVADGEVRPGDALAIRRGALPARVRDIHNAHAPGERSVRAARAGTGDRVGITLGIVAGDRIKPGDVLVDVGGVKRAPGSSSKKAGRHFEPGQIWTYKTRPGERPSRLTILRIEPYRDDTAVHVQVSGLRIRNPAAPDGLSTYITHIPFAERAVNASVLRLVAQGQRLPDFEDGYNEWRRQSEAGRAGIFETSIAEAIDGIEAAFTRGSGMHSADRG